MQVRADIPLSIGDHRRLSLGDDAISVVWCPIDRKLRLYGSHKHIIRLTVERLNAFW